MRRTTNSAGKLDLEGSHHASRRDPVVPIENTPPGEAFSSRRPLVLKGHDPALTSYPFTRELFDQGYCLVCSVPLVSRDRVLGTLNVGSRREDIVPAEVELLAQVGSLVPTPCSTCLPNTSLSLSSSVRR